MYCECGGIQSSTNEDLDSVDCSYGDEEVLSVTLKHLGVNDIRKGYVISNTLQLNVAVDT